MKASFHYIKILVALCLIEGNCALGLKASPELLKHYSGERHYNQVCWLTTHNSFANSAEGWVYKNQYLSFEAQYAFGVRSFMLDVYWYSPILGPKYIVLCHEINANLAASLSSCPATRAARLGSSPQSLESYFVQIKKWLDENPDEIITLHLESYLGSEGAAGLRKLLKSTGLEAYLYADKFPHYFHSWKVGNPQKVHKGAIYWPTLDEMRKKEGRLVIFSDKPEDEMISTYSYDESEYNLGTFPNCEMRRSQEPVGKGILLMMNHFYENEPQIGYEKTNDCRAIIARAKKFRDQQIKWPNFIAVDFVEIGENGGAQAAVIDLNKKIADELTAPVKRDEL
jgi:hypothetical protein